MNNYEKNKQKYKEYKKKYRSIRRGTIKNVHGIPPLNKIERGIVQDFANKILSELDTCPQLTNPYELKKQDIILDKEIATRLRSKYTNKFKIMKSIAVYTAIYFYLHNQELIKQIQTTPYLEAKQW